MSDASNKPKDQTSSIDKEALARDPDLEGFDIEGLEAAKPEGLEHPDYASLQESLTLAEQKVEEHKDKAARALAELQNVRRSAERDVSQAHRYALEKFVDSLLPVVDSLEQAIQLVDKHADEAMHEGLSLTMKLFLDVLAKHQVEQIDPLGAVFDPQCHEAISMQPADAPANTIVVVFQKGYKLHHRVIRPARVIVAK